MKIETEEGAAILLLAMRHAFTKGENASRLVAGKILSQWDSLTNDAKLLIRKEIKDAVQLTGVDSGPWEPVLNKIGW